jgi:hypothetical protein
MPFENSPSRSNESITLSHTRPGTTMSSTNSNRPDSDDYATVIRWTRFVVPLLALLPALGAYFIVGEVLARIH